MSDSSAAQAASTDPPIEVPVDAARPCDLVLKGGIASGIVYPDAVRKLATEFHFMGIAGTSAGAIVASIAAAAEYRRRVERTDAGYRVLDEATQELKEPGRMLELFRPDADTRDTFEVVEEQFLKQTDSPSLAGLLWSLHKKAIVAALVVGIAPGLILGTLGDNGLCAVLLTVFLVGLCSWLLIRRVRGDLDARAGRVVENNYGLCSGMAPGNPPPQDALPPLSEWLHRTIQRAAGKPLDEPLTFGDLHNAPLPECLANRPRREGLRSIDFRVISTCLTLARPFEFPLATRQFAYRRKDLEDYLPTEVLDHLDKSSDLYDAHESPQDKSSRRCAIAGTQPLPETEHFPIVLAARMSLSFPGLLTMVKLWKRDYGLRSSPKISDTQMQPMWFSDGGITSNLPISRFDRALASWPTLGINLQYERQSDEPVEGASRGGRRIYLPDIADSATPDLLYTWFHKRGPLQAFAGWAVSIFTSAQVWTDNSFIQMRTSRERVVEIWLTNEEGGLNLDMPAETLNRLVALGRVAAEQLIDRFVDEQPVRDLEPVQKNSWDQYRWMRLRASAGALSDLLRDFTHAYGNELSLDRPWEDYLKLKPSDHANYKPDSKKHRDAMLEDLRSLVELAHQWALLPVPEDASKDQARFKKGPKPRAQFRAQGTLAK